MACFSEDCHWVKRHGDCFYDGVPPSNSPSSCKKCQFFKAPTNADKIRAMSDEELAKLFGQIENGARNDDQLGSDGWLDWLRQEVSE